MAPDRNCNPGDPNDTGNDTIGYLPLDGVSTQHQTQATIDDARSHYDSTPPYVRNSLNEILKSALLMLILLDTQGSAFSSSKFHFTVDSVTGKGHRENVPALFVSRVSC